MGFDHHVALASTEAQCAKLLEWVPSVSCVFTSYPGLAQSPGWVQAGGLDSNVLWIQRYYACTALAQAGVSVLMTDLDSIIHRDPYPLLHAPPLDAVQLIHLKEGFANGGMFYLRAAAQGSPALWVHTHVMAKANLIVRVRHDDHQDLGTLMDQALLNDNLNAAGCNSSVYDMPSVYVTGPEAHRHKFWATVSPVFGRTAAQLSARQEGGPWYCDWRRSVERYDYPEPPGEAPECDGHLAGDAGCEAQWAAYKRERLNSKELEFLELRLPLDATDPPPAQPPVVERFAAAPEWVFGHCDQAHAGWRSSALIHLVACSADWPAGREWTYPGRRALMVAAGSWHPIALLHPKQAPRQRFLALAPELAAAAPMASRSDASQLFQRLLTAAAAAGRIPVLPAIDCRAAWLEHASWAKGGVFDHSVIKFHGACYPAPGGRACTYKHAIGGYELLQLHGGVGGEADVLLLSDWEAAPVPDADGAGRLNQLRVACPGYWS